MFQYFKRCPKCPIKRTTVKTGALKKLLRYRTKALKERRHTVHVFITKKIRGKLTK